MKSGIYRIRNIKNEKIYPGSAINLSNRWSGHKKDLRKNQHHSTHLQRAWYKYGEENFVFEVLEECEPVKEKLLEREQAYLDQVRIRNTDGTLGGIDHNLAYNICPIAGNSLGVKHTVETKKKNSEAHIGIQAGENHPMYGKHHSKESKEKMSEARKGRPGCMKGKRHTEESKKKMSESSRGLHCGEKSPNAILTWEKVRKIRQNWLLRCCTQRQMAIEHNVSFCTINAIIKNRNWKEENFIV